jgi:thioesterase domain-containing protein
VTELEALLVQLKNARGGGLEQEMWERYGEPHASDEEKAERAREVEARRQILADVPPKLAQLVERTRGEAPAEIEAWCDAHVAYLTAFRAETDDDVRRGVADDELAAWADVRAGKIAYVEENAYYITLNRERYLELFGVAP